MNAPLHDDRITAWLDGTLSPAEHDAFEQERAASADLRAACEQVRTVRDLLRAQASPLPPAGFANAVLDRLDEDDDVITLHRPRRPLGVPVQGWAIAAVAIVVLWLLLPSAAAPPVQHAATTSQLPTVSMSDALEGVKALTVPKALVLSSHSAADVAEAVRASGGRIVARGDGQVVQLPATRAGELVSRLRDLGSVTTIEAPEGALGTVTIDLRFAAP